MIKCYIYPTIYQLQHQTEWKWLWSFMVCLNWVFNQCKSNLHFTSKKIHKHSLHSIKPRKKWHMEKGKCFQSWIIQSFGYYCELWNNYLLLIGFYRHLRVFKSVGKDRHVFKIPNDGKWEFWNHDDTEKSGNIKAQLNCHILFISNIIK